MGMELLKAPNFTLPDQTGKMHSLSDYAGGWVILYFYPEDDTPGCTTEACGFRDDYDLLRERGLTVLGVSKDSVKSHAKFAEKYNLNFTLLSDESLEVLKAYEAWAPKTMFGREFLGTIRKTFLINPAGEIVKEYPKVSPVGHSAAILKDFEALTA
jgi:peroxiredoxin Q/BCP